MLWHIVKPQMSESLWVEKQVSTGALGASDDLNMIQTKIVKSTWVPVHITYHPYIFFKRCYLPIAGKQFKLVIQYKPTSKITYPTVFWVTPSHRRVFTTWRPSMPLDFETSSICRSPGTRDQNPSKDTNKRVQCQGMPHSREYMLNVQLNLAVYACRAEIAGSMDPSSKGMLV